MRRIVMQWLPILALLGCAAIVVVQSRTIRQLRSDNAELRNHVEAPLPALSEVPAQQARVDNEEVMRLRNEVRQLREQVKNDAPPIFSNLVPSYTSFESKAHELTYAAGKGDLTALGKLEQLAMAANERLRKGHNPTEDARAFRGAFAELGRKAGTDETALQVVFRSVRTKYLEGYGIHALGFAAAAGNERALDPLVDPERYALHQSSTVTALKPAADAGNARAIEALANVISQENGRSLWYMAANGLETAAVNGNAVAIDSLARLVMTDEKNARRAAFLALERAALKHPLALEALQRLPRE
jgi:hypothetical protein